MGPKEHLISSGIAAGISYYVTKSSISSFCCFGAGVAPDLDHFIEYFVYKKGKWDNEEFWSGSYFKKKGTLYIIFHSIELLSILLYITFFVIRRKSKFRKLSLGILSGYTTHMILDIIGNNCGFLTYSYFYRWKNKWKVK